MKKYNDGEFNNNTISLWKMFTEMKKCHMCKKKFPDGVTRKNPGTIFPFKAFYMFTPEFLVHMQTTHGITPDAFDIILNKWKEKHNAK